MSELQEDPQEEATEILYKPPSETKHFPLDKVLDDLYNRVESIEKQLNSIFNLP